MLAAYSAVLAHPTVLSISIQIRTADKVMHTENALELDAFVGAFTCAGKLLKRDSHNITHVVVHLSADYQPLRERFATDTMSLFKHWPEQLPRPFPLVTASRIRHSSLDSVFDLGRSAATMQHAVLEQAIIDSSDYIITSQYSGFAQTSVLRSWPKRRAQSVIALNRVSQAGDSIDELSLHGPNYCDVEAAALSSIQQLREVRPRSEVL